MPDASLYTNLLLKEYRIPSITAYNRIEASPRTANFDRSLKAEIRDAMWMLTRQWQFGEFQGEDAASPLTAQVLGEHTTMEQVTFPVGTPFLLPKDVPLETLVERETVMPDLFLAVETGRFFLRLMKDESLLGFFDTLLGDYPLGYTIDKNDTDGLQLMAAVKGQIFDGYSLYNDMITAEGANTKFESWINANVPSQADQTGFKNITTLFVSWFQRNYSQPFSDENKAWLPSQLEYQFSVSSASNQQEVLSADQYFEGHLDWYSFDIAEQGQAVPGDVVRIAEPPVDNFVSFIPSPIAFKGMPLPRFWMMEENQTDFGKIDTSPTGLLHLMLAEFGLIYSNDWFMLPYPLSINTLCEIKAIKITDVFGQEIVIRPAGKGPATNWHQWAMFHHSRKSGTNNSNKFYLPPSITKSLESPPLEEVNFLRDEMANMVWAVENIVPSQSGKGTRGNEMAVISATAPALPVDGSAEIRYVLGTTVPYNWTPFIPVHVNGSDIEIRFQRARLTGSKPAYGVLLKEQPPPYFINEEEIPRAGVIVSRTWQRARWLNGKTLLWIGRLKQAGRGEGWSNLKFDQIEDILK